MLYSYITPCRFLAGCHYYAIIAVSLHTTFSSAIISAITPPPSRHARTTRLRHTPISETFCYGCFAAAIIISLISWLFALHYATPLTTAFFFLAEKHHSYADRLRHYGIEHTACWLSHTPLAYIYDALLCSLMLIFFALMLAAAMPFLYIWKPPPAEAFFRHFSPPLFAVNICCLPLFDDWCLHADTLSMIRYWLFSRGYTLCAMTSTDDIDAVIIYHFRFLHWFAFVTTWAIHTRFSPNTRPPRYWATALLFIDIAAMLAPCPSATFRFHLFRLCRHTLITPTLYLLATLRVYHTYTTVAIWWLISLLRRHAAIRFIDYKHAERLLYIMSWRLFSHYY